MADGGIHPLKRLLAGRTWTRLLASRLTDPVVVLCYHDVRRDDQPDSWLHVLDSAFGAQLDLLSGLGTFLHPDTLLDGEVSGGKGLRFLVTFDDGKAGNHALAWPLLRERGVPALFFLSTHHVDSGEPFWFDVAVAAIQGGGLQRVDLGSLGLGVFTLRAGPPALRWEDIQAVLEAIKGACGETSATMAAVLADIQEQARYRVDRSDAFVRPLTWSEVGEMAADPLVRLGSHAHAHTILTRRTDPELADDLGRSRDLLSAHGRGGDHLAYPNGDHDARVRAAAAAAGYRCGHATTPRAWTRGADPMAVPRVLIGGYDSPAMVRFKINRALVRTLRA